MDFFNQFKLTSINTERGIIRYRKGGKGPPLLMLHGNPQTHLMWHQVAPKLTNDFTLICPDIPGYGKSFKPEISNTHQAYSKVCMAKDIINFMDHKDDILMFVDGDDWLINDDVLENGCPVFFSCMIRGVKNGPSPKWLRDQIESIGLRSISSLVDITNFFTMDRARPLHVFDSDKIEGGLRVSFAKGKILRFSFFPIYSNFLDLSRP